LQVFAKYLEGIDNPDHRARTEEILTWIEEKFPHLEGQIKWNTPMFSDHGTYIIGFSTSKQHMSVAPEEITMVEFADEITQSGYTSTKGLFRIPWKKQVNYDLLEKIIKFNIRDKADLTTFWRK
jgi:uncharacterized protein